MTDNVDPNASASVVSEDATMEQAPSTLDPAAASISPTAAGIASDPNPVAGSDPSDAASTPSAAGKDASPNSKPDATSAGISEDVDAELEAMKRRLHQMEQETMVISPDGAGAGGAATGAAAGGATASGQGAAAAAAAAAAAVASAAAAAAAGGAGVGGLDGGAGGVAGGMGGGGHPGGGSGGPGGMVPDEATIDVDSRSIYVGNVDYKATGDELNQYFQECGTINRVTIMTHKQTGQPKGFAYIEFKEPESVDNALILNESMFRGRGLKVTRKRTNIPAVFRGGYSRGRGRYTRGGRFTRGWRGGVRGGVRGSRGRGRWAPY